MPSRILALFAKAPRPGEVKTRLVPPLDATQAAELYRCMLLDIVDQHADPTTTTATTTTTTTTSGDAERVLWYAPPESRPWFAEHAPGWRLLPQRGPDLASRMRELFRAHAAEGADRIVLRGTDSPTLPHRRIAEAFAALDASANDSARADLVLCPDRDGGYNLIGLRRPCDSLFDFELSTASVLDQTLAAARNAGLRTHLLPAHHDVDTVGDLEHLRTSPRSGGKTPRTDDWLAHHPRL